LAFPAENDAEVVVGLGITRVETDGFLELADRLIDLALLVQGDAKVVVGSGMIRLQANGLLELADGLVQVAFLVEGDASAWRNRASLSFQ
jgi:predicted TIM-barrel enzyme